MSYGNIIPYLRRKFGREGRFGTGSLLFDLHRQMHRKGEDQAEAHKTRLFQGL
jgi:hypothetical protein